jgi:hypothetical protein
LYAWYIFNNKIIPNQGSTRNHMAGYSTFQPKKTVEWTNRSRTKTAFCDQEGLDFLPLLSFSVTPSFSLETCKSLMFKKRKSAVFKSSWLVQCGSHYPGGRDQEDCTLRFQDCTLRFQESQGKKLARPHLNKQARHGDIYLSSQLRGRPQVG